MYPLEPVAPAMILPIAPWLIELAIVESERVFHQRLLLFLGVFPDLAACGLAWLLLEADGGSEDENRIEEGVPRYTEPPATPSKLKKN